MYFVVQNTYLNICALNYKFIPAFVNNSCYKRGSESGSTFAPLLHVVFEKISYLWVKPNYFRCWDMEITQKDVVARTLRKHARTIFLARSGKTQRLAVL